MLKCMVVWETEAFPRKVGEKGFGFPNHHFFLEMRRGIPVSYNANNAHVKRGGSFTFSGEVAEWLKATVC